MSRYDITYFLVMNYFLVPTDNIYVFICIYALVNNHIKYQIKRNMLIHSYYNIELVTKIPQKAFDFATDDLSFLYLQEI